MAERRRRRAEQKHADPPAPADLDDEDALLTAYSALLEQLAEQPYSRALHRAHLALAAKLALPDALAAARETFAQYFALDERPFFPSSFRVQCACTRARPAEHRLHRHLARLDRRRKSHDCTG